MGTLTRVCVYGTKTLSLIKKITFFSLDMYIGQRRDDEEDKVGQEKKEKKKRKNISYSRIFLKNIFLTIRYNSNKISYLNNVIIKFIVPIL